MSATYGSSSTTIVVMAPCEGGFPDPSVGCDWHEMHHLDDEGRHWCPTGFMLCHAHGGIGTIVGSGTCQLWGERP